MATNHGSPVLRHVRRAVLGDGADLSDGHLLSCFIEQRDEDAFAALVKRHGPMVWGVCHRVLGSHQDAEDAFQATFLVLVRKAACIVPREMLGNWLYGVAFQTAVRVRSMNTKRRARERQVEKMPEPAAAEQDLWDDLRPLLDQELSRLPDKYRAAVVLCDLEGKTYQQAARQIGCPPGTLAARLSRGRAMLAKRLARHGLVVSGGALAAVLSQNVATAGVPPAVVFSTIKAASLFAAGQAAATGIVSVKVAALTEGVLKSMFLTKLKTATAGILLLALALGGVGAGGLHYRTQAAPAPKRTAEKEKARQAATIDGLVGGKEVQSDAKSVEAGADAAAQLLAASNVVTFLNPGQPIDKDVWKEEVITGIENKRPHLRIRFTKPRQIEGNLNGVMVKYSVSEVVFFEPNEKGPICLWGRDGDRYYFANQIAGHEALVKWLCEAQKR